MKTGEIEIVRVRSARQAEVFQRLYELYCHELAPITGMRPDASCSYGGDGLAAEAAVQKGVELWLARDGEGPVGFLWLEKAGAAWAVDQLYVLPRFRRAGLAGRLVRHGLGRHEGPWEVFVLDGNEAALAFWRRLLPTLAQWTEQEETRDGRRGRVWRGNLAGGAEG